MEKPRYSLLAFSSVVFNIPWIYATVWMIDILVHRTGPIAGEIALIPGMFFMTLGVVAGVLGIVSLYLICNSNGKLRGKWIARFGILLTSLGPIFALLVYSSVIRF